MARDKISKTYAKAISELSVGKKELTQIAEELGAVAEFSQTHEELRLVFRGELFSKDQRTAVALGVAEKMKLTKSTQSILKLLAEGDRLRDLGGIAKQLKSRLLQSEGIVPLEVESREKLSDADCKSIEKSFESYFKKEVSASYSVDPTLIGGIRVSASGKTYDGTLKARLSKMQEQLVGGL